MGAVRVNPERARGRVLPLGKRCGVYPITMLKFGDCGDSVPVVVGYLPVRDVFV